MKTFAKTGTVEATGMTRLAYNELRGWELPSDENGKDKGFLVCRKEGESNVDGYDGYVNWVTEEEFYSTHKEVVGMTFGEAIELLKQGKKVARSGWNGKKMYLSFKAGYPNGVPANASHAKSHNITEGDLIIYDPYIEMKTTTGSFVPWLASQTDVLAEDWNIVD